MYDPVKELLATDTVPPYLPDGKRMKLKKSCSLAVSTQLYSHSKTNLPLLHTLMVWAEATASELHHVGCLSRHPTPQHLRKPSSSSS